MLNLNCVMIGSEDPRKLADFYGQVLDKKPDMDQDSMIGFMAGGCFLGFGPHNKVHGTNQNPERIMFFFETKDVQAEFDRVKTIPGVVVVKEPYSPSGDGTIALSTLADPDGNYFQIVRTWND